jgi:hypothetical protein
MAIKIFKRKLELDNLNANPRIFAESGRGG